MIEKMMIQKLFPLLLVFPIFWACGASLSTPNADTTAPLTNTTNPSTGSTVPPNTGTISFQSDETLDANNSTVALSCGGASVSTGSLSFSSDDFTLSGNITGTLTAGSSCEAIWTVQDSSGNESSETVVFTVSATDDSTAPTVNSSTPPNGGTGVSTSLSEVKYTFSEAMDSTKCAKGNLSSSPTLTISSCSYSSSSTSCTCAIDGSLSTSTGYSVTLSSQRDAAGNALGDQTVTFTTGSASDTIAPTVSQTIPAEGAASFSVIQEIFVCFDEEVSSADCRTNSITTSPAPFSGSIVACVVTGDPACAATEFKYSLDFDGGDSWLNATLYTFCVGGNSEGISDTSGNKMTESCWTATTQP